MATAADGQESADDTAHDGADDGDQQDEYDADAEDTPPGTTNQFTAAAERFGYALAFQDDCLGNEQEADEQIDAGNDQEDKADADDDGVGKGGDQEGDKHGAA